MKRICIIPARGGSKRIPRKNCKDFLGKPIIAYSIEAALNSNLFDIIMVSTDDEEIAEIALKYGANVPFIRSAKNSSDFATTFDVIEEVIAFYKTNSVIFEQACCLYATAPLITIENLKKAFFLLKKENFSSIFPVIRYGFPIQRAIEMLENHKLKLIHPEHELTRSQDLKPRFHDAGQFYAFVPDEILKQKKLYTVNSGIFEILEQEAQDIDNQIDWKLAELKYQLKNNV